MPFLFRDQLSTDELISHVVYIFIVPFPVCAGINSYSIPVWAGINFNSIPNAEMELSICVVTFCHLCQLITDLRRCWMYVSFLALVCLFVVFLFSVFDMNLLSL